MHHGLDCNFLFNFLFTYYKLKPVEAALYFVIRDTYFSKGICHLSDELLASRINVSESTAKKTLKYLKKLGLIETQTIKRNGCIIKRYIYPLEDNIMKIVIEMIKKLRENSEM